MKITFLQIEEAYSRAIMGESVRSIARSFGVTEGCLRFHFRKSTHPRDIRRLAFELFHLRQRQAMMDEEERRAVNAFVAKQRARA